VTKSNVFGFLAFWLFLHFWCNHLGTDLFPWSCFWDVHWRTKFVHPSPVLSHVNNVCSERAFPLWVSINTMLPLVVCSTTDEYKTPWCHQACFPFRLDRTLVETPARNKNPSQPLFQHISSFPPPTPKAKQISSI